MSVSEQNVEGTTGRARGPPPGLLWPLPGTLLTFSATSVPTGAGQGGEDVGPEAQKHLGLCRQGGSRSPGNALCVWPPANY